MNFNEILDDINGWGLYQKRLYFILTFLFEIFATQNVVFMMFGGAAPKWHCDKILTMNNTIYNFDSNTSTVDNCTVYRTCEKVVYEEGLQSVATEVFAHQLW